VESCTKQWYIPLPQHLSGLYAKHTVEHDTGERAAQVVPHVHFHIIPRPPLVSADAMAASPSWTMFGRGRREDLDDDEGEELARLLREELAREVKRVKQEEGIDLDVDRDYRL
jgi:diadenosine tetraphosphate (Ap4A) HIT family hydrolase